MSKQSILSKRRNVKKASETFDAMTVDLLQSGNEK